MLAYLLRDNTGGLAAFYLDAGLQFWLWISAAAFTQLYATVLQTLLVRRRNFAIGIMYLKVMLPGQAAFGVVFFAESLTSLQWVAVLVATLGVVLMARSKVAGAGSAQRWDWPSLWMGLGAGTILAFTGLFIREATQALDTENLSAFSRGVGSLLALASLQLLTCSLAIYWRDAREFGDLLRRYRVVMFTGLMSVLGSMCWFVGFALAHPALVNTVGQSEFLFAMLLSLFFFKERPSRTEMMGMAVMLSAILLILWP